MTPPLDLLTTAVLGLLTGSGQTVYDAQYTGDAIQPAYPYAILYCLLGGDADPLPDLDGDDDTVTVSFQVTSVSNWRNQCQWLGARLRGRLLDRGPAGGFVNALPDMPAGWACVDRRMDPAMPGVDRVGEPPNVLFAEPARYLLTFTPSSA